MGLGTVKTSWITVILPPYSSSIILGYLIYRKTFLLFGDGVPKPLPLGMGGQEKMQRKCSSDLDKMMINISRQIWRIDIQYGY